MSHLSRRSSIKLLSLRHIDAFLHKQIIQEKRRFASSEEGRFLCSLMDQKNDTSLYAMLNAYTIIDAKQ